MDYMEEDGQSLAKCSIYAIRASQEAYVSFDVDSI